MALLAHVNFGQLLDYRFDAECYRPELQAVERRIAEMEPRTIESIATVTDGNHVSIAEHFCESGIRYLKGAELSDVFIDDTEPTYISRELYSQISRAQIFPGDVLLSVIGSVGPVALVTDKYICLSCSCKLAILRPHGMSGAMLAAYLLSPTGQALLLRRNRGSVQQGIVLPDIRSFPVPKFSRALVGKVEKVMAEAYAEKRRSDCLYPEAEAELLDRLGWEKLRENPIELSYVRKFSELTVSARFDAEHYRPQPNIVREWLTKTGSQTIDDLCHFVEHGFQPPYIEGGSVGIVSQRQFRNAGLDLDSLENFTDMDFLKENPKFRIQRSDVLTYCVSAGEYLGRTFLFNSDIPCVAASFVTILRTKSVVPGYLALFLNSPPGLIQSNMFKRGTSPFYLYPRDLKQVLVPIPRQKSGEVDIAWQKRLAAKVEASTAAKAAARAKLEEAKRLVEKALN